MGIATTVFLLCLVGLIVLYSASLYMEIPFFQRVVGRQLIWMFIGLSALIVVQFIQRRLIFDSAYMLYSIGIGLLVLPFLLGDSGNGADRWIRLGYFNFQPSEFVKIMVILAMARYLSKSDLLVSDFKSLIVPILVVLLPMAIILKQPDLGTAMVYFALIFPMLLWAGARLFHIFIFVAPILSVITAFNFYTFFIWVVLLSIVLYFSKEKIWISSALAIFNLSLGFLTPFLWNRLKPYQQNRILTLFNLEADPQGAGYQVIQSQIAIGSGGLFGKGIGNGTQTHLKFLPEQHNDFIFSVIGEEYGFIGVTITLVLHFGLIILLITTAYRLRERFSSLVTIGAATVLFTHLTVNVAMTIGLLPVTGLPLPFISYGGSFLLVCFILIGLVLMLNSDRGS